MSVVTVTSSLLAWVALRMLQGRWPRAGARVWLGLCTIVAAASLGGPLLLAVGAANQAALICLHLTCAAAIVALLAPSRATGAGASRTHTDVEPVPAAKGARGSRSPGHGSAATALTVVLDLVAPMVVFYGLRWAGAGVFLALIAGAIAPTISMLLRVIKAQRVDKLAVAVLGALLLSAAVSLIEGSPQFLAAKDGVLTAAWGGWFFISLRGSRPLTFRFSRPLLEGRKVFDFRRRRWVPPREESWDKLWQQSPRFRRIWAVTTVIWGVALLVDAAVRVVMAYTLPIDSVPGLSGALWMVTLVALQVVTNIYYSR